MKFKFGFFALVFGISMIGCKNESTEQTPAETTESTTNLTTEPMTPPADASGAAATAEGMNPPHGQPGHRCDIAVGAPLNSAPAAVNTASVFKNATTAETPAPQPGNTQPVNITNSATPATTAPGMNPPHGQPGHRCDIAVGAPLDSKPKQ